MPTEIDRTVLVVPSGPLEGWVLTGTADGSLHRVGHDGREVVHVADVARANVLAITGQGAVTRLHKESPQAMDVVAMFDPITKWAESVYDARTIPEIVRKAFKLAQAEKPGATHIELPEDIAKEEVDDAPIVPGLKVRRPVADDKSIYPYVPDMIRFYLDEEPILANVPTFQCRKPAELSHVLAHLPELVVKETQGSGGYGMFHALRWHGETIRFGCE